MQVDDWARCFLVHIPLAAWCILYPLIPTRFGSLHKSSFMSETEIFEGHAFLLKKICKYWCNWRCKKKTAQRKIEFRGICCTSPSLSWVWFFLFFFLFIHPFRSPDVDDCHVIVNDKSTEFMLATVVEEAGKWVFRTHTKNDKSAHQNNYFYYCRALNVFCLNMVWTKS